MTEEILSELRIRVNKAEALKNQIEELKKVKEKSDEIKLWGVCLYFDQECEDRLYVDLFPGDIYKFINEFVLNKIKVLEKEFETL